MKIFSVILSLYILVLSGIKCHDAPAFNKHDHSTELAQENEKDHIDTCSPFCTCDCCAAPVIYQQYSINFTCLDLFKKILSEYHSNFVSSHFTSIWQPPKIS